MSKKRFVDVNIWQKEWYQELTLKEKLLVKYLFENCDNAGIWDCNYRMASFVIGETVTKDDIEKINSKRLLYEFTENNKIFIPEFINFQYGELSLKCKPHIQVINLLKKYDLYERVCKGYAKGMDTLKDKDKDKDKDKEIDKDIDIENDKKIVDFKNPDLMFDKNVNKVFDEYETKCTNCLKLKFEKRDIDLRQKIFEFLKYIKFDFNYVSELCEKANALKKIYDNPIDFKAFIKNHERIYNGFYIGKNNETTKTDPTNTDDIFTMMDKNRGAI